MNIDILVFLLLGFGLIYIVTWFVRSHYRMKKIFETSYQDERDDWNDWDQQK